MNKESVLKKEFKKSDVQRMRNIITGKSGDRTQLLSGWEKKNQDHKEGDIWEEDGKKWTIKNGIKQTVTKLDRFKHLVVMPLTCPKCGKPMKVDELNKKMYSIHHTCFDCVIETEAELKKQGKWEEYVSEQRTQNKNSDLIDLEQALEAWYNQEDTFVTEQGDVESWIGGDKTETYKKLKEEIEKAKEIKL